MSVWDEDVFTEDNLHHALGAVAVSAAIVFPAIFAGTWSLAISVPLSLYAWGWVREVAQSDGYWMAPARNFHKFCEAMSWGVVATIAVPPVVLFFG